MAERNISVVRDDAPAATDLFNDKRLELIRTMTGNAPPDLFMAMIEIARVRGLDPLAKQISLIKYGSDWQITTTIDGYRAIAEKTGVYAGSDEAVFTESGRTTKSGKPHPDTASVTVWKLVEGQRVPFTARVRWDEYDGGNFTWNKMPFTMLGKVAESHALRKAFPSVLSGVYTDDEMGPAGSVVEATATVRDSTPPARPNTPQRRSTSVTASPPAQLTQAAPGSTPASRKAAIDELTKLAAKVTVNPDDLLLIAWHQCGVQALEELDGKGIYTVTKLLQKSEGDLADVVFAAREAAEAFQANQAGSVPDGEVIDADAVIVDEPGA
jgi:phage recombination protein Bet